MVESVSCEDFDLMLLDEVSEGECSVVDISDVSEEDLQTSSINSENNSDSKKDCHNGPDPSVRIAKHPRIRPVSRSPSPPPSLINLMKQGISVLEKAFWTGRSKDGQKRNISSNECSAKTLIDSRDRRICYDRDKESQRMSASKFRDRSRDHTSKPSDSHSSTERTYNGTRSSRRIGSRHRNSRESNTRRSRRERRYGTDDSESSRRSRSKSSNYSSSSIGISQKRNENYSLQNISPYKINANPCNQNRSTNITATTQRRHSIPSISKGGTRNYRSISPQMEGRVNSGLRTENCDFSQNDHSNETNRGIHINYNSSDWQPPIFPQAGTSSNFPMFWPTRPQVAQLTPGGYLEPFGPQSQHRPHPRYIPPPPLPPIFHIRQHQPGITNPQGQFEYPPEVLQSTSAATFSEARAANSSDTKSDTALNSSRSIDGSQTKAVMDNTDREPEKNENSAGATRTKTSGEKENAADKPYTQQGHSSQQKASCAEIITINSPNTSDISNALNEQNQPNSLPTIQDNARESNLNRGPQKQQHGGSNRQSSLIANAEDNTPANSSPNNSEQNLNTSTNITSEQEMGSNSDFNEEYKETIQKLKKQFPEYGSILADIDENRPLASIAQPLLSSNIDSVHSILRNIRENRQEQQQAPIRSDETEFNLAVAEEDPSPSNMNHHRSTDEMTTPVTPESAPESQEEDATVPPGLIQPRRNAENPGSKLGDPRIMRVSGQSERSSTDSTIAASQITPSCSNSTATVTQFGGIIFKPLQNPVQPRPKSPHPSTSNSNSLTISPSLNAIFPEAPTTVASKKSQISVKLGQNSVMTDAQGAKKNALWDNFKQQITGSSSSNLNSTSLSEELTPGEHSPSSGSASSSTAKVPRADGSHMDESRNKTVKVAPPPVPAPLQLNLTGQNTKSTSIVNPIEKPVNKEIPPLPQDMPPNKRPRDVIPPPPERREERDRRRGKTVDPRNHKPGPVSNSNCSRDSSENKSPKGNESGSNHDESRDRKRDKSRDDPRNPKPRPATVSVSNRSSGSSEFLSISGEGRDGSTNPNEVETMRSGQNEKVARRERHISGNPQISPAFTASSSESSAEWRSPRALIEPCSARTQKELQKPIKPRDADEEKKFKENLCDFQCLKTAEMDLRWRRLMKETLAKSEFEKQELERILTEKWKEERFQLLRQYDTEKKTKENLVGRLNTLQAEKGDLERTITETRTNCTTLLERYREVERERDCAKAQLETIQNQPTTSTASPSHVDELVRQLQEYRNDSLNSLNRLQDATRKHEEELESINKHHMERLASITAEHDEALRENHNRWKANSESLSKALAKYKEKNADLEKRLKSTAEKPVTKDQETNTEFSPVDATCLQNAVNETNALKASLQETLQLYKDKVRHENKESIENESLKIRLAKMKIKSTRSQDETEQLKFEIEELKEKFAALTCRQTASATTQTETGQDTTTSEKQSYSLVHIGTQTPPQRPRRRDGSIPSSTPSRSSSQESQLPAAVLRVRANLTNTSCRPLTVNAQGPSHNSEQKIAETIRARDNSEGNPDIIVLSDDDSPAATESQPSASESSVQQASTAGPSQKRKANISANKDGPMTDFSVSAAKRSCNSDKPQGSQNRVLDSLPLQSVMSQTSPPQIQSQATVNAPNTSASVEAPVAISPPAVTQNHLEAAPASSQNSAPVVLGFAVAQNPTTGKEDYAVKKEAQEEDDDEITFIRTSKMGKNTVQPTIAPAESTSAESPPLLVPSTEEFTAPPRSPTGVCDSTEPGNRSRHSSGIGNSSIQPCRQLQPQISRIGNFTNPGQQQNVNLSGIQSGTQSMNIAVIALQNALTESGTASPNQQNQYNTNATTVVQMNPALMSNNPWASIVHQNQIPFPQSQPRPIAQQMGTVQPGMIISPQNFPNQPTNITGTHIIQPQRTFNTAILNHFRHLPHNQAQMDPLAQYMQQTRNALNVQLNGTGPTGYGSQQPNSSSSCQAAAEQRIVQSFCIFLKQHRSFASVSRSDLLIEFCNQQQIAREVQPDIIRQLEPLVDAFNAMLQENSAVVFNRQKNQSG